MWRPRRLVLDSRSHRRVWAVAVAFASLSASAGPAKAAEAYVLTYQGAQGCPAEEAVHADVAAQVHDTSRAAGARVDLRIVKEETGFRGSLIATDENGNQRRRSVEGRACSEVAHALAFLAGLAIELGGHLEIEAGSTKTSQPPAPPPPLAPPTLASPKPPHPSAVPAPVPPRAPLSSPSFSTSIVALGELRGGLADGPRPAGILALDVEAAEPTLFGESGRVALVGGESRIDSPAGSVQLWLLGGRLEACPVRLRIIARIAVRPCAGGELGAVVVQGKTPPTPRSGTALWGQIEVTLRVRWLVSGGFFLELGGGPAFPVARPRYFVEPDATLYAVPPVTWRAAIGPGFQFE